MPGKIAGPRCEASLKLVLDTGASLTLIVPRVAEVLGYSARDADAVTNVYSPLGREQGYALRVARFAALGFAMADFTVNVLDLSDGGSIDGLVGLNFLEHFNYQVRSAEGCILLENLAPLAA
ncbi:MAG TPA: retropepsin-like aspartic protease [Kofleriaceae bacterium]